jgi:hypothetical protein
LGEGGEMTQTLYAHVNKRKKTAVSKEKRKKERKGKEGRNEGRKKEKEQRKEGNCLCLQMT